MTIIPGAAIVSGSSRNSGLSESHQSWRQAHCPKFPREKKQIIPFLLLAPVCNLWFSCFLTDALIASGDKEVVMSTARPEPRLKPASPRAQPAPTQPFRSADEAWIWTMTALRARREGVRHTSNTGKTPRPCEPDDVIRCLDTLYRRRRIDLVHVRILRIWGERRCAPNPAYAVERCDFRLWREALDRLDWPLRLKGIVV
jgi:hypothetical protein